MTSSRNHRGWLLWITGPLARDESQDSAGQNGIYVVHGTSIASECFLSRSLDADETGDLDGLRVVVNLLEGVGAGSYELQGPYEDLEVLTL